MKKNIRFSHLILLLLLVTISISIVQAQNVKQESVPDSNVPVNKTYDKWDTEMQEVLDIQNKYKKENEQIINKQNQEKLLKISKAKGYITSYNLMH